MDSLVYLPGTQDGYPFLKTHLVPDRHLTFAHVSLTIN